MSAEPKVSAFAVADADGRYVLVKGNTLQLFIARPAAEFQVKRMAMEGVKNVEVRPLASFDLVQAMYAADNVIIIDKLNKPREYAMIKSQDRLRAITYLSRQTMRLQAPQLSKMR